MRLVYTDTSFAPYGTAMARVPVLLNEDHAIVEVPQGWLFEIALHRGRTSSPETWASYAAALYDWFQTCEANGWEWDRIEEAHLAAYRNKMLHYPSPVTGRPYSPRTINGRLRRLAMFYGWAFRHGHIAYLPFEYESVRTSRDPNANALAHLGYGEEGAALKLTVRERRALPRALSVAAVRRIRTHLTIRDGLIADWAVATGARRKEVLGLTVAQIPSSQTIGDSSFVAIPITVTKGGRPRDLHVPIPLIDRTNRYIAEERGPLLRRLGLVGTDRKALWLGARGTPLSAKALNKNFLAATKKAGVPATFHALRHTYAIFMLATLTRRDRDREDSGVNALKTLQILLGHASLHTTSLYLSSLDLDPSTLEGSIDEIYGLLQ